MDGVIFEDFETSTSNKELDFLEKFSEEPKSDKAYNNIVFEIYIESFTYKVDLEELKSRSIQHNYELCGENFILEKKDNKIILAHNVWSLYAEGVSLLDAESNLIYEAKELAEVFLKIPPSSLDLNALKLREFLFKVI